MQPAPSNCDVVRQLFLRSSGDLSIGMVNSEGGTERPNTALTPA